MIDRYTTGVRMDKAATVHSPQERIKEFILDPRITSQLHREATVTPRNRKIVTLIAVIILLEAFFQLVWARIYTPSLLASLNPYPTEEYLRIMWLFSPNGLSIITLVLGLAFIAWVALANPERGNPPP